jgi:hypothetical protein
MKLGMSFLPKSSLGKWSFILSMVFLLIIVLSQIPTGFNGFDPGLNPTIFALLLALLIGLSVAGFVTGLVSIIKHKERSLLVIIGVIISFWIGLLGAVGYFFI